jgi:methylated-DNA-protein-cysteine methyltransferase-like protein
MAQHQSLVIEAKARTAHYARINAQIFAVAASVPPGRVTTFGAIAALVDAPRHHVAFLLSRSADPERCAVPWFRAVGRDGAVRWSEGDRRALEQRDLLRREGVRIDAAGLILNFAQLFFQPSQGSVES